MNLARITQLSTVLLFILATVPAHSHSGSTAYLELTQDHHQASGAYWLALKDLHTAVGLDADGDGNIRFNEVKAQTSAIQQFAASNLSAFAGEEACTVQWGVLALSKLDDGIYARLPVTIACQENLQLNGLVYSGLFDFDTSHRLIGKITQADVTRTVLFSPSEQQLTWQFTGSTWLNTLTTYVEQGVIHILVGYDHLLFLLALLVPIVFASGRDKNAQSERRDLRQLSTSLLKVVTAFTLGHSVTLIAASVFGITPPIAWVETIIAVSVVVAGLNIVVPFFREACWKVAATFGLVHGFGFASVLAELALDSGHLFLSLLSFNLGVEIGQLFVVLMATPLLLLLANGAWIPTLARYGAAGVAACIGTLWVIERIPV